MLKGAHVVQPVGQLDEHHAHIGDHGQQHLAHVFGLAVLAVGKLDLVDLSHALDDVRHLIAEAGRNFLIRGGGVLYRVVQKAGRDGRRVHLHLRQHLSHLERMDYVGFAGSPHLPFMMLDAEVPGLSDEGNVFAGTVGLDLPEQRFKTLIDRTLRDGWFHIARSALRLPGGERGGAGIICRYGLPDSRHASLYAANVRCA